MYKRTFNIWCTAFCFTVFFCTKSIVGRSTTSADKLYARFWIWIKFVSHYFHFAIPSGRSSLTGLAWGVLCCKPNVWQIMGEEWCKDYWLIQILRFYISIAITFLAVFLTHLFRFESIHFWQCTSYRSKRFTLGSLVIECEAFESTSAQPLCDWTSFTRFQHRWKPFKTWKVYLI